MGLMKQSGMATTSGGGGGGGGGEVEEINTKDLAQRISAELKRYSIPQAIFAQRVLCRSQGTLSDLLRNPKPWSKLKSGRETFRRMWKWLQEPEFQRMSSLRLAETKTVNIMGSFYNILLQSRHKTFLSGFHLTILLLKFHKVFVLQNKFYIHVHMNFSLKSHMKKCVAILVGFHSKSKIYLEFIAAFF
ncbi:hypothetical protein HAZT_HAZT000611 [Hyalella azteca]|uniref:CUT domain-containing protein n=1 Tax=Hyalella azteca TaxID=294128 RepID=A0A6A0GRV9_HYAAZ|nr:hypothetical protein HAZT_HAZT000611 [Hyalella azteca]